MSGQNRFIWLQRRFAIFFPSLASVTMATVTASNQFKWVFFIALPTKCIHQ